MMRTTFMLLFMATALACFSQETSKRSLQRQRELLSSQLEALNKQVATTNNNISATAKQRAALQQQVTVCRGKIARLDQQLGSVQNTLEQTDARLSAIQTKLTALKRSYAASLVLGWKLMNESQVIGAVYASNSENKAQQRAEYIKILRRLQLNMASEIRMLQQQYHVRKKQLGITGEQVAASLQQQVHTSALLQGREQTLNAEAARLQEKRNALLALMKRKKDMQRAIENRLAILVSTPKPVNKPFTRSPGKNPAPVAGTKAPVTPKAPAAMLKSDSRFRSNKGYLPCPVNGRVIMPFGLVVIDQVKLYNQFLTFETGSAGAPVSVVFPGEVTAVEKDENQYLVMVLHGDLYTVYGNLGAVHVQKGQQLSANTVIGKTSLNTSTGKGEMEFGIYENKKLVDPASWLGCR